MTSKTSHVWYSAEAAEALGLGIGDKAFFTEHGRRMRVLVISPPGYEGEHHVQTQRVIFVDDDDGEYAVPVSMLEPDAAGIWDLIGEGGLKPQLAAANSERFEVSAVLQTGAEAEEAPAYAEAPEGVVIPLQRLTRAQRETLAAVDTLKATKAPSDRREAHRLLSELQAEIGGLARAYEDGVRHLEVIDLGASRGAVDWEEGGRVRLSRDGLETLLQSGAVDASEYAAGLKVRDIYVELEPVLKSQMNDSIGGGGDGAGRQQRHLELLLTIKTIEAKVAAAEKASWRALEADLEEAEGKKGATGVRRKLRAVFILRAVAGKGECISHHAKGATATAYRNALILALGVVGDHFGLH